MSPRFAALLLLPLGPLRMGASALDTLVAQADANTLDAWNTAHPCRPK